MVKVYIQSEQFARKKETEANREDPAGILDGLTLFRFSHMWRNESSGGVEAYLRNLNRHLLKRNRMRILQMYLVPESGPFDIEIEQVGRGELVWIPSILKSSSGQQTTKAQRLWARLRGRLDPNFLVCHDILFSSLVRYQPSLAVFHWISEDSRTVLDFLNNKRVPFVVINHFQNTRLKRRLIRSQISKALAIGGVSGIDMPVFVRSRFTNLSDGVDTDFFHPGKAVPLGRKIEGPLILLPSRITAEKGHIDAVRAMGWLAMEEVNAFLAFAGRQESPAFTEKLKRVISKEGVQERVIFAGELRPEELRNWYAASGIVVLPSYTEGLGRVLLEAQAMGRPVVAYAVGGVAEAIGQGETGFLVRRGDVEGLAIRLSELLGDQVKRCKMAERGRKFIVERFSLDSLAIRHEKFYAKTLNHLGLRLKNMVDPQDRATQL
jgi:glycosyltransferase involved in cell wall biosynthesis